MAKLVFGMNQSLDGYVDHMAFAPDPALFRHWIEQVRAVAGSVYGRRMYDVMRSKSVTATNSTRGAAAEKAWLSLFSPTFALQASQTLTGTAGLRGATISRASRRDRGQREKTSPASMIDLGQDFFAAICYPFVHWDAGWLGGPRAFAER